MPIQRVQEAIEEIKKGNMVIMMDDENRENEGDLVYAAVFSTPEKVNFMASEAKGLICVSISRDDALRLELKPMVDKNNSSHETAFTVSVDAKGCSTGISAFERDDTIKLLSNPTTGADDLVRPGHIFPLIAKDGGVLVRTGHTEGSIDLCKMAGLYPAGVICEIMKDNGEMARRDDLDIFAKKHNLKIVFISDIVEYRLKRESLVKQLLVKESSFLGHSATEYHFEDHRKRVHKVFSFGQNKYLSNVKFHTVKSDFETFYNYEKYKSFIDSVSFLSNNGGLLIFMDNSMLDTDEVREYGIGAQILISLGVHKLKLLTSNPALEFSALDGFGLEIVERIVI